MKAWVCREPRAPLSLEERPQPSPRAGQILIRIEACGVCRTDLHIRDGELTNIAYPVVPGHQVVGRIAEAGPDAALPVGARIGAAWLGHTCGACRYCATGQENLCDRARFHGCDIDGGFADYMLADARYCFPLDDAQPPAWTAPLLCAGLIGFRSLRMAGDAQRIGIYGFGSAGHIVAQVAHHRGQAVYAFTSPGDIETQQFARELGADWAGGSDEPAPCRLDAALIFAPVGALIPRALQDIRKGGTVVCGGIHMSDIPSFGYAQLWGERVIRSVANLTRQDGHDFLELAREGFLRPRISEYRMDDANRALDDLANGRVNGSAVLTAAHS